MSMQALAERVHIPDWMVAGLRSRGGALDEARLEECERFAQAARAYPDVFERIISLAGVLAPLGEVDSLEIEEGKRRLALNILALVDLGEKAEDYRKEQNNDG